MGARFRVVFTFQVSSKWDLLAPDEQLMRIFASKAPPFAVAGK
jgi:hypothetical protein